ncbi:MAG: universal stress protein [Gemmatimonadota bacterium]|nr:universal stress protein [Gemmatimonadota bacterium]
MFPRILVTLDGSPDARRASQLALVLAERFESRVSAQFVIDTRVVEGPAVETLAPLWGEMSSRPFRAEVMEAWTARGDETLAEFAGRAVTAGREHVERHLDVGVAEEAILARAAGADLVVMGRRGEHAGFGRHPIGSTVSRVLRRAPHPVLLAAPGPADGGGNGGGDGDGANGAPAGPATAAAAPPSLPRVCAVACDGREPSIRALDLAVRYAEAVDGEVRVVAAGGDEADAVLEPAQRLLHDHGVPWESARLDADPPEAVAEALARWKADCLFMGAFGRSRLHDLLLGSRTDAILEAVRVPAFLVR